MDNKITEATTHLLTLNFKGNSQRVFVDETGLGWWCYRDIYMIFGLSIPWERFKKVPKCHRRVIKVPVEQKQGNKSVIQSRGMIFVDWSGLKKIVSKCGNPVVGGMFKSWAEDMVFNRIQGIIDDTDKKPASPKSLPDSERIEQKEAAGEIKQGEGDTGINIIPFNFRGKPVRVFMDKNGDPLWIIKDVCDACGDKHYLRTMSRLDKDEKVMTKVSYPGGSQMMAAVNEAGLYRMLLRMRPHKKTDIDRVDLLDEFQRLVTHVILPTIRRTGSYTIPGRELEVKERRYTTDKLDHMAHQLGVLIDSLTPLAPIVIENKMRLDNTVVKVNEVVQSINNAHLRITDVYNLADTSASIANAVSSRMDAFDARQEAIEKALLPDISKTTRDKIFENARVYANIHKYNPHAVVESLLYRFKKERHIDLRQLSAEAGNLDPFDIAERIGEIENLHLLSIRMFVGK